VVLDLVDVDVVLLLAGLRDAAEGEEKQSEERREEESGLRGHPCRKTGLPILGRSSSGS
jgi:hypothetical protein